MSTDPDDGDDIIDEEPMTRSEIEQALHPITSRGERRLIINKLYQAGLIVFRA